ncbi:dynein regulatory complex subunit 2 isoform X1 [Brienomyrus brachyistius]|uniref:dynein regulatory complex subunit 2 isoform X1 n=1 Tax=Brienomyrus brachyistius TaxID=42636 RepID=UPI0020B208FC|nr:dynein regulatory complex subunit 2 isoform X1 [Brienomyrus brachyistius]
MSKGAKRVTKGKKAAMTEEEKILFMQQRALAEEDMEKRKEDMLTQFLKDKLQKEERNSTVNRLKLTQQWRTVLRKARVEELHRDVAVLSQTFERILDHKDSIIKSLVSDLMEAEQQSSLAVSSHLQFVDRLLDLHKARLESLQQTWANELEELSKEFNAERVLLTSQHQAESTYLQDVNFAMDDHYRNVYREVQDDFYSTRDDVRNQNAEEMQMIQDQQKGTVQKRMEELEQEHHRYLKATENQQVACNALQASDQQSAQEIEEQMRKLRMIQTKIAKLRAQLNSRQGESTLMAQDLRAAKTDVLLQTQQLMTELGCTRATERRRLTDLTVRSNAAAKTLRGVIEKGEKLLRLSEMCRKLETEQEKVLPFYSCSLSAEEKSLGACGTVEVLTEELAKPPVAQAMQDHSALEHFWQRYNKAQLERLCLERERAELSQENQRLRLLLRQYLDSISVNDELHLQQRPLLVVRQPALAIVGDSRGKRHTVVEAAHAMKHTL